jgi:hypothetical protein
MPELNEKLIACVLRHIEEHQEEYDQNVWCVIRDEQEDGEMCGTAGCFAGWTCLLSKPVDEWGTLWSMRTGHFGDENYYFENGRKLLGLDYDEARVLFAATNFQDPQTNLRIIKQRLVSIRRGRGLPDEPVVSEVKDADKTNVLP